MVRLENIFMPESAAEPDSLQVGKHMLSPLPLPSRAEDEQDTVVTVPTFTDPPEFADEESSNSIPGRVAASLTTPACVSLFSSVLIHLLVWGTALILLPIFGFDWLEPALSAGPRRGARRRQRRRRCARGRRGGALFRRAPAGQPGAT